MKYAREVIDLMAAFPGKAFRMSEIVRYIAPGASENKVRQRVRNQTLNVLNQLESCGSIEIERNNQQGAFSIYKWKL